MATNPVTDESDFIKISQVVFELRLATDKHIDTHTDRHMGIAAVTERQPVFRL